MKKRIFLVAGAIALLFSMEPAAACTSAVVSGRATPDGRPLLWKHRDTDFLRNHVAYVAGERYGFLADVNSDNFPSLREAWVGVNSAGFALMNTQSYNLVEVGEGEERGEANGRVIYRALELCATVEDFCHLLDTLAKPSLIEANFGVIDAQGGAAMFEVDYYRYTMYDANDPQVAPLGYIARTNFSLSGKEDEGAGYVRFMEAERVLNEAAMQKAVTPQGIFNDLSRSFHNCKLGIDLRTAGYQWFVDQDFIPRRSTSCSVVVQGVEAGERPELTTMWTLLGYPPTGIAVPLWVEGADRLLPSAVGYDPACKAAPLSDRSLRLAGQVFSFHQGMGTDRYLDWTLLQQYMRSLAPVEEDIFRRTSSLLEGWRKRGTIDDSELRQFYQSLDVLVGSENQPHTD